MGGGEEGGHEKEEKPEKKGQVTSSSVDSRSENKYNLTIIVTLI